MKRIWQLVFWSFIVFVTSVGFRTYSNIEMWNISNLSTSSAKIFVSFPEDTTEVPNDLPASDPAAGSGTITVANLMASIFDDYNSIQSAFVTLVSDADPDFSALGSFRTITMGMGGEKGLSSGHASLSTIDGHVIDCNIQIKQEKLQSAKEFVRVVTHEIGHCLGLDHPQDTVEAIMSYFSSDDDVRLKIDDKMGIVYLYPVNPSNAEEKNTFGLSCSAD